MSSGGAALQPTFTGHVATTQDALILFEGCLQGHLSHVPRRPHDRERSTLIRSGSVFIYEENASGIKRWTDGVTWSPSRILGNFLVYRELDKPFPPGEKKRAMKKPNRRPSRPGEPYPRPDGRAGEYSSSSPTSSYGNERQPTDAERQLIGSLIDSYGFKVDGLVKKTMSVTVQGVTHHLVSYYNVNGVMAGTLRTPSQTESLQYIRPRPELIQKQSFRSPIEDGEDVSELTGQQGYAYRIGAGGYEYGKQQQYYLSQPYPPMAGQPPMHTQYPGSIPSMAPNYLSSPVPTGQMGQDRTQFGHYDQNGYGRTMPPTPTSSIPTSMPDRGQPQSIMYPPTTMSRPIPALSPMSVDTRNNMAYRPPNYSGIQSITSPVEAQRSTQPSPAIKYEERRDHQQPATPSFPSPAQPYYGSNQMAGAWSTPAQQ
ncbi:Global transcription regulator sge1 [Neophaeococcomyces mojaviensis]|uniref:Global transcription regulator sge1 n=1 Tax=Neophaeococcomyces mojaviensis TaxID=3383035 RepID=A0ACC3AK59_9EURO|nr:Global transcription regulator sge1 [Knufia sp. JES_112]